MHKPELFIVIGPNGSGKSSALFESAISKNLPFVNPDDVAQSDFSDIEDIHKRNILAWKECNVQRECMLARRITFGFETVGSHPSKLEIIDTAHSYGYVVTVMFVGTENPQINIERIASRVLKGGHGVPNEKVISRYKRTMNMLYDYYLKADTMQIWDNSITSPNEKTCTIRKLLFKDNAKTYITDEAKEVDWFQKYFLQKYEGK